LEFRKLRLAGFKSFVEPVDLLIEPGLTGVVGPNGCGKSNLLEALRWVMGEASPKSMRSGGMDDVIFAGTAARPARQFASVTLHLAGSAGEEIEVSRRIERGTGSDYRLNGRDSRQQDIRLLFADSATGAHSPAIVGQGRISAIIAAKPAERRQLLEEAAGIAGLAVRRREAEIRLRAAEANVTRLDDVIRGLEAQANTLRRQAKSAERYRQLSDRIRHGEAALIHARWHAAVAASERARKAAAAAETLTAERTRLAASLAGDAATATAGLPALRTAEAEAAAAAQAIRQGRALADAEVAEITRRDAALAAMLASLDRDAAREAALAADADAAGGVGRQAVVVTCGHGVRPTGEGGIRWPCWSRCAGRAGRSNGWTTSRASPGRTCPWRSGWRSSCSLWRGSRRWPVSSPSCMSSAARWRRG
jgi:chromosome segregation protein